jgi:hypothetical protein
MNDQKTLKITREKHLDHMVKVVPFIALIYAVQSYVLWKMDGPINGTSLLVLGCLLVMMIGVFLLYDLKHQCELFEDHLKISFLGLNKTIFYNQIEFIKTTDPTESFGSVFIKAKNQKTRLYFVDDVGGVRDFIMNKISPTQTKQAA